MSDKKKSFFDIDTLRSSIINSLGDDNGESLAEIEKLVHHILAEKSCFLVGENALSHAYGVAAITAKLGLGKEVVYASLLFLSPALSDDPDVDLNKLVDLVDPGTFSLLKGVLGVLRIKFFRYDDLQKPSSQLMHAESFRQMILALVEDIRVVIIVLSSHLQTLRYLTTTDKSIFHERFAQVILSIFAPLANRLGVWQLKWELEDLSFRFYKPELYQSIVNKLSSKREERQLFIQYCIDSLSAILSKEEMDYKIYGRPKHIYSIYNKMNYKNLDFHDLYDIHAIRILVPSVRDCYMVLGVVHSLWAPISKEFDDYILQPKSNLYQSLHTVVQVVADKNLEVQIRTFDMHKNAELGVASHWLYKERSGTSSYGEKISLLRQLLTWRDDLAQQPMWADYTQRAELNQTIYVFTPQGRIISLPRGSTPIDFAYALHTEVGHRCRGAKVDGSIVSLDTPLDTGQQVEIMTSKQGGPSRDWLGNSPVYSVSNRARSKIKHYFHHIDDVSDDVFFKGKQVFSKKIAQYKLSNITSEDVASALGFSDVQLLYRAAYNGDISPKMWRSLVEDSSKVDAVNICAVPQLSKKTSLDFSVMGVSGLSTRLANCCHPIPSDEMMGFITSDYCVSIHRSDCPNLLKICEKNPERTVPVHCNQIMHLMGLSWPYSFKMEFINSDNVLKELMDVFSRHQGRITKFLSNLHRDVLVVYVVWETNPDRYEESILLLKKIPGFIRVYRV
ncbi:MULTISPECIES: RelA/SpoT family protein [Candidatus Ichthyocystis]|uniref:RelA/SpoT family protein n=1 Tax=Candidatus Ichthyocystis TaxID=2929841 RepID=UPI001585001D|nr:MULTISPECIES: HD domain-containing protein [Ichthyocystis]